jgi:hypothetical protein
MWKTITKYVLPRLVWFKLFYGQWFKNQEGLKGFAAQVMNWLMQQTMALAEKLKNQNKRLQKNIEAAKARLDKMYKHPTVDADEWDEIKSKVRTLGFWITVGIVAEAALNYFGVSSIIQLKGWGWMLLNVTLALALTGLGVYIFKQWFTLLFNKPKYKQENAPKRSWVKLITVAVVCLGYLCVIYYLCKVRGIALEGANGDSIVENFVVLAGMLLPVIAGYLAAERNIYISAYKNTIRITREENGVAKMKLKIAANQQKMEDHFKRQVEMRWALFEEFKTYKENYNLKKGLKKEELTGHFCEHHDSFKKEANKRYVSKMTELEQKNENKPLLLGMPLN